MQKPVMSAVMNPFGVHAGQLSNVTGGAFSVFPTKGKNVRSATVAVDAQNQGKFATGKKSSWGTDASGDKSYHPKEIDTVNSKPGGPNPPATQQITGWVHENGKGGSDNPLEIPDSPSGPF
jgi:hypothetical protein